MSRYSWRGGAEQSLFEKLPLGSPEFTFAIAVTIIVRMRPEPVRDVPDRVHLEKGEVKG